MINTSSTEQVEIQTEPIEKARGKKTLRVASGLFMLAAVICMVFGILGLLGVGLTDTFYLDAAITEARSLSKSVEGEQIWTDESWDNLQAQLIIARSTINDRASTQEQINLANINLRLAIESMTPTEAFIDIELEEILPGSRTVSTLFSYMILLSLMLGFTGFLGVRYGSERKKTRKLATFGVVSFLGIILLVFIAVNALGYEILHLFAPVFSETISSVLVILLALSIPIIYIIGVYKGDRSISIIIYFSVLIGLAAIVLFPLWWIIRTALMHPREIMSMSLLPPSWVFSNLEETLKTFHYYTYLRNTFIIITPSVLLGTTTAILCAFSFARLRFRFKKFVFGLCIATMMLPPVVTLIPLYIMFTNFFGFNESFMPLIIPWICGGGAFNIFLMRQFIMTLPKELDEAAMIDGAGRMRILFQILVPSIKPAIMVVAIFIFMLIWNDLLTQTLYLQTNMNMATMAMGLRVFSGSYDMNWPFTMMATVLSIIPGLLIYMFGQKYLVEGIVMTGMKN